jgi:hypothetical protein
MGNINRCFKSETKNDENYDWIIYGRQDDNNTSLILNSIKNINETYVLKDPNEYINKKGHFEITVFFPRVYHNKKLIGGYTRFMIYLKETYVL